MPANRRIRDDAEPIGITDFLTYRLLHTVHLMNRAGQRWHQQHTGLSLAEWRVLATLGHFGTETSSSLSDRMMVDKAVVSRIKTSLLDRGLIHEHSVEGDSRKRLLELTARGRALYHQTIPRARDRQQVIRQLVDARELAAFERVLNTLEAHFENQLDDD